MKHITILLLPALVPVLLLGGCRSDGADGGADSAFFRTPNRESEKKPVVKDPITLLFPTGKERRWEMAVRAMDKLNTESVRVDEPRTMNGVTNATTLTMYQNGKAYRSEIFQVKPESLSLVAAGGAEKMLMSPPMLLLRTQAPEGAEYKWEGEITFKGAKAPAQAYSRVHAPREVVTPAGKFTAYRVDTALTTIIEGNTVTFPASRWFVPGVGIVKQVFRVGNAEVEKQLTSFKGG
ncbi:MAG: hypothetical protein H7Y38_07630 [Armatimonadetes bacterium]|nr:hypothetical protein [Armatimonadota bacterium]